MSDPSNEDIISEMRHLLAERSPGKTICPSEVARALSSDEDKWRGLMPRVREVAAQLADKDEIIVTQKGDPVDIREARGPVRLAQKPLVR